MNDISYIVLTSECSVTHFRRNEKCRKKNPVYTHYAKDATALLGEQIKLRRKQHRWSESNLAERAGISRQTVQRIEKGAMNCAIGLVFEVAALVGVPLFDSENLPLSVQRERVQDKIALLPKRIMVNNRVVHDHGGCIRN